MVVCRISNGINKVTLHQVLFVLGLRQCLRTSKPPPYVSSRPGQLSLLPSAGWEMSISQSAVTLCDWGVEWFISSVDARVDCGWQVNCVKLR